MDRTLVTSFRMYAAAPRAAQAWRALFERVFADARVTVDFIDHRWPEPIAELWAKPQLCCAFMCGWPFARSGAMQPIAAPVPSPPRYAGLPRYCSEFLVREASGWTSLGQAFGHRFGWMAEDSQSGFNAPRAHLAAFVTPQRPRLFSQSIGPLGSPMKALEALREKRVDAVALDSFFLDLCRHHEPERLAGLRCLATTPWTPIPLLVAAPGVAASVVSSLREHLASLHERLGYAPLLADVLLERFVAPDPGAYAALEDLARFAAGRGYVDIR
jgi:ABC-type phosphate/phosphonate transport system substrate-binding protein